MDTPPSSSGDSVASFEKGSPARGAVAELHEAVRRNDIERVQRLIMSGVDANKADENGWTALHIAARKGLPKMVDALLTYGGADPRLQTKKGQNTPLHLCAIPYVDTPLKDRISVANRLMEDWRTNVRARNAGGQTPEELAERIGQKPMKEVLEATAAYRDSLLGNRTVMEEVRSAFPHSSVAGAHRIAS